MGDEYLNYYFLLGTSISLAICYFIFSLFMDKKTLKKIFTAVIALLFVVVVQVFIQTYHRTTDIVQYFKLKYPFFELIANRSPTDFEKYTASVKNADKNTALVLTGGFINSEAAKYSQVASNKSLYNFFKQTLENYKIISEKEPILVLQLTFPLKFQDKIDYSKPDLYVKDYTENIIKLKGEIITSGIEDPHPITDEERDRARTILQDILSSVKTTYGDDFVQQALLHPEDPALDTKKAAAVIIAFYEGILAQTEEDAGIVMKQIMEP